MPQTWRQENSVLWTVAEPDMHVGVMGSRTLGFVIRVDGSFIAFDHESNPLGRYQRLRTAKQSVETSPARRSLR